MPQPTSRPGSFSPAQSRTGDQCLADLAQVLAHRMRGPLTSIQCYTELLADGLGAYEERDMVLRILESVSALEKTLADLNRYGLDVTPMPRAVDAGRLVADALTVLGDESAEVEVRVEEGGVVEGDPLLLQQALLILLENALDATGTAQGEGPAVHCSVRRESAGATGLAVRFDVWNAGALGVSEEQVFAPFFTTKSSNLGVGLSIARRIAAAHGGHLRLTTDEGNGDEAGVTFTLLLPAIANHVGSASGESDSGSL